MPESDQAIARSAQGAPYTADNTPDAFAAIYGGGVLLGPPDNHPIQTPDGRYFYGHKWTAEDEAEVLELTGGNPASAAAAKEVTYGKP